MWLYVIAHQLGGVSPYLAAHLAGEHVAHEDGPTKLLPTCSLVQLTVGLIIAAARAYDAATLRHVGHDTRAHGGNERLEC